MNIAKHMEVIFCAAIALAAATSIATAAAAAAPARHPAAAPFEGKMQVVTIVGKRLSAADTSRIAQ